MKILVISPFLFGPNVDHAGGRDLFHIVESLAARHQISLVAQDSRNDDADCELALKRFCARVEVIRDSGPMIKLIRFLLHFWWPRGVAMSYSPEMARRVNQLLLESEFDLVQCENIQTVPYARLARIPKVLDCIDVTFLPVFQQHLVGRGSRLRRMLRSFEWPRLQVFETDAIRRFDGFLARSKRDAFLIGLFNSSAPVALTTVWPVTLPLVSDPSRPKPRPRPAGKVVMFVGAMWRSINSEACSFFLDKIWPLVTRRVPDAEFWVVGGSPPKSLLDQNGYKNVKVTGFVQDLLPYYRACAVVVVPLLASGGIIAKIADAMRAGIPVVATSVANQGIDATPNRDILIADAPEMFADAVVRLLTDADLYAEISENAEAFMEAAFDWDASIRGLESLYFKTVSEFARKQST